VKAPAVIATDEKEGKPVAEKSSDEVVDRVYEINLKDKM
jgi:hypothetical protein